MKQSTANRQRHEKSVEDRQDFLTVLDTIPDSYFEADPRGVFTYANRSLYRNLGLCERDEVVGLPFRRFTAPQSIRTLVTQFRALYRTGKPVPRFEYYFRCADGGVRLGEASISPILRDGEVVGSRGFIRDISDRVLTEAQLREAKTAAEARSAELSAVNRVATKVGQSLDLAEILQSICGELTAIFPVRNAGVGLITPDKQHMEVVAFRSPYPDEESALGMVLPFADSSSSQEVIRTKRTLVVQDSQTDPRSGAMSEIARARGTRAIMIVPVLSRGEAIGTIGMPATDPYYVFTDREVELAETIASQIAAAIDNARLHGRTESALNVLERDLEIGREIQSGFFPEALPEIPGWEIAAEFRAARHVAGDFYDVFRLKNAPYTAFAIADVCDKGIGAALFMVLFRSLLRAFSERIVGTKDPEHQLLDVVTSTNAYIAEYHGRSNMFATLFLGILDPETSDFYYVNGGHESPVVLNKRGEITRRLTPTGPAVGLLPGLEFAVEQYRFAHGDCLVGFTDGATDAQSSSRARFSEQRLLRAVAYPWTSLFSMLFELTEDLKRHTGEQPQFDDITLLSIRRTEQGAAPVHAICRPATVDVVPEIREFVAGAAAYHGISPDEQFALKTAADELCTNIAQYGYPDREPGVLSVALTVEQTRDDPGAIARLTITDDGVHFPPDTTPEPNVTADWTEREPGGLGIYLIRQLVDSINYERLPAGVNRLVIGKHINNSNTGGSRDNGNP